MPKAPKPASAARQARKDRRKGSTREERLIKTAIDNDAAKRNKERAMLAQVLIRREPKRGGITAKRALEMQQLFKKGKCLPTLTAEQVVEKQLREAAVAELQEARVRIEEARVEALRKEAEGGQEGEIGTNMEEDITGPEPVSADEEE